MFEADNSAIETRAGATAWLPHVNFRTPADPDAGWAARNPDQAMLFLFVSPRNCGALDELMAV